ncbi:hypothetical protein KUH32_13560 [Thalassococcus sp. CAU 1522]|uniref:TonB-dependent receptor n=1 Tax=Thalassococcus arenae TaxID=2851652 RepID=A0ABS6N9U0_9RHOB|nr:hypothetical protein [Thalassococcus arenae]MBV2360790.1 hypothetical protein [Thalassococcus arenae]
MTNSQKAVRNTAATALALAVLGIAPVPLWAQDVVTQPVGANAEPASGVLASDAGFAITINGTSPGTTTPAPADGPAAAARRADVALAEADIRVTFDGLGAKPRLTALLLNPVPPEPGEVVRLQSQLNYPAYVTRGEMRILDLAAPGGARLLQVVPVDPNGVTSFTLPEGQSLVAVHRVYDARGRYDETRPLPLRASDAAPYLTDDGIAVEEGETTLARSRIPVHGGAVTVSGSDVRPGAVVTALGERIEPDGQGRFVIQRILPAGDHPVAVQVTGAGHDTFVERGVTIPASDWFYTGTVDLTYGWRMNRATNRALGLDDDYSYGRIAGYAKGKTQSGWTITARIDTGEEELDELFRDLDKKDPQSVLLRMQREDAYPTYGDDSSIEDGAPSDGKVYLKAERNGSHLMWGNYRAEITNPYFLRQERELYGFQGVYRSQDTTSRGQSRVAAELYAASPDQVPGRDVFRGTGGSAYFLQRQDIAVGSETVTVQLRDGDTGRVIETRTLTEGRDYTINYLQGVVLLNQPLNGSTGGGLIVTDPGGETAVQLVVQYEYTPAFGDIDGMAYGGRIEAWATDRLRLGVTGLVEDTDIADQRASGADLRYELSERTYLDLEYARSEGPGFGSTFSNTGGLVSETRGTAGLAGIEGEAWRIAGQADFEELGFALPGSVAAYYEKRTAGFSSLDYQVDDNEELWGLSFELQPREDVALRFYYDELNDATGKSVREGGVELGLTLNARVQLDLGAEHLSKRTPGGDADETGSRTDVAARVTFTESDRFKWWLFGQATVARDGGFEDNHRVGAGVRYRFAENWTFDGEVSDGSQGVAGEAIFTYQSEGYDSAYFGYRLEPGREFSGVDLRGSDRGTYVAGGKRRVSDDVDFYGEATYDLFGRHKALTNIYGVEYRRTEHLTWTGALEVGQIDDGPDQFDRHAVSLGVRYDDGESLQATGRLEYRLDEGDIAGNDRDQEVFLLTASARYKLDDERRMVFSLEWAETETDNSSIRSGSYVDATLGYAYRPVLNDKLNLLLKYRYLYDMIGQETDGGRNDRGPVQESHVLSLDMAYDLTPQWTLGAKLGGRWSNSAPDADTPLQQNDAWLVVANARYHLTHKWDVLIEGRHLEADQAGLSETAFLGAVYRHVGNNLKLGLGYNFGSFSDDLTDLTYDDEGAFVNLIAKF